VRVGWFKIAIRIWGCIAVCRGVWLRRCGERKGGEGLLSGSITGGILFGGKAKGVAGTVTYGLWYAGECGGEDVWLWMRRISLSMVGLRYVGAE
jgi:hypothetical protein